MSWEKEPCSSWFLAMLRFRMSSGSFFFFDYF